MKSTDLQRVFKLRSITTIKILACALQGNKAKEVNMESFENTNSGLRRLVNVFSLDFS